MLSGFLYGRTQQDTCILAWLVLYSLSRDYHVSMQYFTSHVMLGSVPCPFLVKHIFWKSCAVFKLLICCHKFAFHRWLMWPDFHPNSYSDCRLLWLTQAPTPKVFETPELKVDWDVFMLLMDEKWCSQSAVLKLSKSVQACRSGGPQNYDCFLKWSTILLTLFPPKLANCSYLPVCAFPYAVSSHFSQLTTLV